MRFRRKRRTADDSAGGEDAFLDIVANLVGILVILVMVIGVRAQDAWIESNGTVATDNGLEDLQQSRTKTASTHRSLTSSVHEVQQQAVELQQLTQIKQQERHHLKVLLTAARMTLDEHREELSETEQKQVAVAAEMRELKDALNRVESQRDSLEAERKRPITLEHLPTPLARTVFGGEEHFRLKHGRIAYVPMHELTDLLKADAPRRVQMLATASQVTETLGPVQDFHLRYTMHRRNLEAATRVGSISRQVAELKKFVLVPMSDVIGEPLTQALESNSQFHQLVDTFRPGKTVVTVWTYPDSFGEYRTLKKWLYDRGFSSAARPLPENQPISGSPNGSRSAAQ